MESGNTGVEGNPLTFKDLRATMLFVGTTYRQLLPEDVAHFVSIVEMENVLADCDTQLVVASANLNKSLFFNYLFLLELGNTGVGGSPLTFRHLKATMLFAGTIYHQLLPEDVTHFVSILKMENVLADRDVELVDWW